MYLSKLTLNPRSRRVVAELNQRYELHRTLMCAFPDDDSGRVLFRVETPRASSEPFVLVQSELEPEWSALRQAGDYLLGPPSTKSFELRPMDGQVLRFRLVANPTRSCDGKRLGILQEDEQVEWLHRQGQRSGFAPLTVQTGPQGFVKTRKNGHTLTFYSVQFDGVLQVNETDQFVQTMHTGLGRAKAFGCGLLSIAPAV